MRASWTARAAKRLFESLTASAGNDLERAVTHARQTLTEQDPQWAALAYYARPADGRSVTFEAAAAAAVAALPIAGHTHAARHIRLDADRTYLNTGTWSDLIPWPPLGSDEDARRFIDELDANQVPVRRRLTWALIDARGAQLCSA